MDGKYFVFLKENPIFYIRIVCFDTGNDEGTVKVIFDHPLMKTVYAIGYDANKRKLNYRK